MTALHVAGPTNEYQPKATPFVMAWTLNNFQYITDHVYPCHSNISMNSRRSQHKLTFEQTAHKGSMQQNLGIIAFMFMQLPVS
jgi:hypothetical protein